MAFEEFAPYFGLLAASLALSCLSTMCWIHQGRRIRGLQDRIISIEQRPLQQIQVIAQDTGYGQAYQPVPLPTAPPAYYLPSAPAYGTNVI